MGWFCFTWWAPEEAFYNRHYNHCQCSAPKSACTTAYTPLWYHPGRSV